MAQVFGVDAFTQTMFRGNPAGVVLLDRPADPGWMQLVATELSYPATAFVDLSRTDGAPKGLRWFSPTTELTLCGHATLASAHILGGNQLFDTQSGTLSCSAGPDGAISMKFPVDPVCPEPPSVELQTGLADVTMRSIWRGRMDVLVVVASAAEVRGLRPDLRALADVAARAVIVSAPGDGDADIVSRVFAPSVGIGEDAVTGSAHCTLADFWCERLGSSELIAEQASPRGGLVRVRLGDDGVVLTGDAVTVTSGELHD
ncbi:PhzF family phenazine biosynthesis protein [Mycobacterium shimoidei]|uniref:Putative isomerase [Saccharothrix espanaensis DSM] n=1 Tax=Mycobacterium shimoidei TaxID=29313 RepID=A0A1E3TEI8_MYCSH|nr:PhzF family phenazine biosynthesis protein [Mycobacterium shimoidei]MCV7260263.1 PhzF family phenazine biosynthesis protein [Mycobacterium shimoidei]ODR12849.1 oxidoreductase [Mycobacterium shimoidei]ORW80735.1 oxidoreductase [Mycobacterium shimoidei]SRX96292.1 putative isomerase [Saccharothrix espanaensis DSM] [Mycobacterium shimoidei]